MDKFFIVLLYFIFLY